MMDDVIKRIKPIVPYKIYCLSLYYTQDKLIKLYQHLDKNKNVTSKDILEYLKGNYDYLNLILMLVNINIILELYHNCNFLGNYWSQELIDLVIKRSKDRFVQKLYDNKNYCEELIILNNCINSKYNFIDIVILDKIKRIEKIFGMNLSNYYFGTNFVLYLSSKYYNDKIIYLGLYPKSDMVRIILNKDNINLLSKKNNILIIQNKNTNVRLLINLFSYGNFGFIIHNYDEQLLFDGEKIYTRIETYQNLNEYIEPNNYGFIKDSELQNYEWGDKKTRVYMNKINNNLVLRCYICKQIFDPDLIYQEYTSLCITCAMVNYNKRTEFCNLENKNIGALITGIRQKIGYKTCLKLLRCGAKVIGTTRYPNSTLYNYQQEHDYDKFKDRLIIYKCDFLNIKQVKKLIQFVKDENINILINNVAQTIRPSEYYLEKIYTLEKILSNTKLLTYEDTNNQTNNQNNDQIVKFDNEIIKKELMKNQIVFNKFKDVLDIDIKSESSWNKKFEDVDAGEILESIAINQTVPSLLVSQLKKYMIGPVFIINVTCLEGQFNTSKAETHVHTNMCKSAMNMMIRTLSEEKNVYAYCIDPGFVSGVNPTREDFPLSDDDGASRILDPIVSYFNGNPLPKEWVKLRNYKPEEW